MTGEERARLARLERKRTAKGAIAKPVPITVPHIGKFAMDGDYLAQRLFPRQLLLLKVIFCALELLTNYDRQVLAEWSAGLTRGLRADGTAGFVGSYGIAPDVIERMQWCRDHGRGWFREVIAVVGRRGSKGLIGAIAAAYVLWWLLATGDPQKHYGLPRGKQLHILIFAGKYDQAKVNQFKDIADLLENAPCFRPYLASRTADTLLLFSPQQVADGVTDPKRAAIVIRAAESTPLSGRGPAAPVILFDEMAHMTAAGSNRSAEEMYSAATPATAQFGTESLIYQASSPWQQQGQFFASYVRGLAVDAETDAPIDPDVLVVHLPSWDLYRDWELTGGDGLIAWPDGPLLPLQPYAMFDEHNAGAERRRADPENFDVEYGAQWATSMSPYLRPADVDRVFAQWQGRTLTVEGTGSLAREYVAHGDPARSNNNFAFVIAHAETDSDGVRHVVVDVIHIWRPGDFDNQTINYRTVTDEIKQYLLAFPLASLTFDQYNSAGLLDDLRHFAHTDPRLQRRPTIDERTATHRSNYVDAETFKTAALQGLVHAPYHALADAELRNLELRNGRVDHPHRGPVQTSDIADSLMAVTTTLLGDGNGLLLGRALGNLGLRGVSMRPSFLPGDDPIATQLSRFGRGRSPAPYNPSRGLRRPRNGF